MKIQPITNNYNTQKQNNPKFGMKIDFSTPAVPRQLWESLDETAKQIKDTGIKEIFLEYGRKQILTFLESIIFHNADEKAQLIRYGKDIKIKQLDFQTHILGETPEIIASSSNGNIKTSPQAQVPDLELLVTLEDGSKYRFSKTESIPATIQQMEIINLKQTEPARLKDQLIGQIQ